MTPISSWAISAIEGFALTKPIWERTHASVGFKVKIINDSLWLTAGFAAGPKMAFRLAFSPGNALELERIKEDMSEINFSLSAPFLSLSVKLQFPNAEDPVFRYTTTITSKLELHIPFWPKDMLPLNSTNKLRKEGTIHAQQVGTRSGLLHLTISGAKNLSVFYFQNLTALNPFFEATKTSAADLVGGEWPEMGFSLPVVKQDPLPANREFVVADAFVNLSEKNPAGDVQIAKAFLENLSFIYGLLPKPDTKYQEWRTIADRQIKALADHKGCWTFVGGHPYLNAYLCDYKTPPEIMVQLAVLLPMLEYCDWRGENHPVTDIIERGLTAFYSEKLNTLVRWLPALEGNLDESEEQKQKGVMDAWYLHHPLTNLTRLAIRGNTMAKELLGKSIDFPIKVARHFNYEWPVFYKMDTLEVIKAETQPGKGGEKDVPGAYGKLMMEVWQLTGEKKYLTEAKKAVKNLKDLGFDIFYQANNTAFSAVALLRLYKHTKEQWYLDLSYVCIASIFKNMQLWDCNYGEGKNFPTFFSVFPLSDAPYTAAYEEQEVYSTLHGYLQEAVGIDILPSVSLLIAEFLKHSIYRMPYYFPPMLPKDMLSKEVKTGEVDPDLWIPLEDIHDGWEKSGEVGQEVYGASLAFGIVPRQYFKVPEADFMIFIDYPASEVSFDKGKSLHFKLLGDEQMTCNLRLIFDKKPAKNRRIQLHCVDGKKKETAFEPLDVKAKHWIYELPGNCTVHLKW